MFTLLLEVIFMIPTHIIVSHFLWLEWMAELIFLPFAIERKTRQSFISRSSLQTIRWREKLWNGSNITYTTNAMMLWSLPKSQIIFQYYFPSQIEKSSQLICVARMKISRFEHEWVWERSLQILILEQNHLWFKNFFIGE